MVLPNYAEEFDALMLVHIDSILYDDPTIELPPQYKADMLEVIEQFRAAGKPIFYDPDEGFVDSELEEALADAHKLDNSGYGAELQSDVDSIVEKVGKPREEIRLAFGGMFTESCVWNTADPYCQTVEATIQGDENDKVPRPIGFGRVLDEIVLEEGVFSSGNKTRVDRELANSYRAFADELGMPTSVLHPCSGFDASPSYVFERVVYLNLFDVETDALRVERSVDARTQDVRTYRSDEKHDLLILFNPGIPPEWATQHLEIGGYVIMNNYNHEGSHNVAGSFFENPTYELVAVIDNDTFTSELSKETEGAFESCESVEELERLRPREYGLLQMQITRELRAVQESVTGNLQTDLETWRRYEMGRIAGGVEEPMGRIIPAKDLVDTLPLKREHDLYVFRKVA